MSATVHVVVGPVGVGKTTYGRRWAAAHGAVHLVLDEWMRTLYAPDAPTPPSLEWMLPRVRRCEAMMWSVVEQVVRGGLPCLIELGLFRRDERDRLRAEATGRGLALQLHHLSAPAAVRAARVAARNAGGSTLTVEVDDATFAWAEGYYQPLDDDERRGAIEVDTSG